MNNCNRNILLLPAESGVHFLDVNQIVRIKAISNYCRLYFSDIRFPLTVARTLCWFEQQLPLSSFIRIHRGHLINPLHIKCYRSIRGLLILQNDEILPVAKRRKSALNKKLTDLVINNLLSPIDLLTKKTIAA